MGRTGISVVGMTDEDARLISNQFNISEDYLRRIIDKYVPANTRLPVEWMNYRKLRRYGYVIKGIADSKVKKLEEKVKAEKAQVNLF